MGAIIENQRVTKRSKKSLSGHNNKSAGFNSEFMSQFNQRPIRSSSSSSSRKRGSSSLFAKVGQFVRKNKNSRFNSRHNSRSSRSGDRVREHAPRRSSGFSFPIPSVATLAVVAGTVLIALTALNWENINIDMPEKYVFSPSSEITEQRTMQYASTGVPGMMIQPHAASSIAASVASRVAVDIPAVVSAITEGAPPAQAENKGDARHLVTFEWQEYRVQRGDSVSSIAQKFGVSVGAVIASNNITNARRLQEGAVLRIPNIDGIPYSVRAGDNLSRIAANFNVPLEVILDVNDIRSDRIRVGETIFIPGARMNDMDLRRSMGERFIFPVPSRFVTSGFGMRRCPISGALNFHTGIDLRASIGTPVVASMDGVVSVVRQNRIYGKYIILTHPNGYRTLYAHLNSFSVREGDRVSQGRKIGESGNTGFSTGPHLHFSIFDRNNRLINPLDLLH